MKAKLTRALPVLFPLCVAFALLGGGLLIHNYPALVPAPDCDDGALSCVLSRDLLRELSALSYDLKRSRYSRRTLPLISIYLSDGALEKLDGKRREALASAGQILVTEDTDWVAGSVVSDNGAGAQETPVQLRLKGDWVDHFDHPTKLSFRIKVRDSAYIFGMKRFSIQHPKTRKYQLEKLFIDEVRHWGLLAPRYQFVEVRINDYRIGVMALEEHYSKELLESQSRREGPIITLDEDPMWRQRDLNYRVNQSAIAGLHPEGSHLVARDFAVRQFQAPLTGDLAPAAIQGQRAQALYRDYIDGRTAAADTFDIEQMARWWVLTNSWNACHAAEPHNRRFYFNPVTARLEPIAFDNYLAPTIYRQRDSTCDHFVSSYLMSDPRFKAEVLRFSELLVQRYSDDSWLAGLRQSQMLYLKILGLDSMSGEAVYAADILENLAHFLEIMPWNPGPRVVNDEPNLFALRYPDAELISHLRVFWSLEPGGLRLTLKNLTGHPVEQIKVSHDGRRIGELAELPSFSRWPGKHSVSLFLPGSFDVSVPLDLEYQFRGVSQRVQGIHQYRDLEPGFKDARSFFSRSLGKVNVDASTSTVTLDGGQFALDENMELPEGWSLVLKEGTELLFGPGVVLRLNGALLASGARDNPVQIAVSSDLTYRGIGAGGGILVTQAAARSTLRHVHWRGGGESAILANRQDYHGLTGCLTFYESEVDIIDSVFTDAHCEDAVNAVRTSVLLDNVSIIRPTADGFDCDFCTGEITDSRFEDTGNDGVDVSGSDIRLADLEFRRIGDKAVSAGEQSTVSIEGMVVRGATTGIASKDLSRVKVTAAEMSGITGTGLISYVKKSEFGGASIECNHSNFDTVRKLVAVQQGSSILIDGVTQPVVNFDQVQLREAGYVIGP